MNEYYIYCSLSGENFCPSNSRGKFNDFIITFLNDEGEEDVITKKDDFKYEFGNLTLIPQKKITDNFGSVFSEFLIDLLKLATQLDLTELDVSVHLDLAYETQCNFELSLDEIQLLNNLNATFSITCYQK